MTKLEMRLWDLAIRWAWELEAQVDMENARFFTHWRNDLHDFMYMD